LGITSVINQIEEHSLKNFKNIDDCAQIQMDNVHAYSRQGSLIIENSQQKKLMTLYVKNADGSNATILKDIASTGKDWGFIKNGEDGDFNLIDFECYAYEDLQNRINEQKNNQKILDNDGKNSQVQKVEGLIINEEEKEDGFILVGNEDLSNRINEQKKEQKILDNNDRNSEAEEDYGYILVGKKNISYEDSSNPDEAQLAGSWDYSDDFEIIS